MGSYTMMEHKGYKARIMEAERLVGDHVHGLPPGRALPVYHSDMFLQWPKNWIHGCGTFLVPVRPGKGLWFDWTSCDANNTAILPTVKGCNPITGLQTSGFHLERYDTKCPKHGCNFLADRFCPECNYKWPFGNYVAAPNILWLDGFMNTGDGSIRQFFFTEEEMRDIATHLIGSENTVPAFGFAFYKPKEPRPSQPAIYRGFCDGMSVGSIPQMYSDSTGDTDAYWKHLPKSYNNTAGSYISMKNLDKTQVTYISGMPIIGEDGGTQWANLSNAGKSEMLCSCAAAQVDMPAEVMESPRDEIRGLVSSELQKPVKEVSVGAGARIRQELNPDPYPLDSWCDKPEAVMTIYFVFQEKFEELKAGGIRDLFGVKEGMLEGMPVG